MAANLHMIILVRFLQWKLASFDNIFVKIRSLGCDKWKVIIGFDNALALIRQQAII